MAPDTAADEVRRFEEQYRQNPESLVFARLADAYRRTGDTDRALELLEEGIARHPEYASAFIIRARTYTDLQRYEQAEEALRRVLDLDAQNQVAMLGLADLAERRGAVSEALGWQERIIAAYPQNQEAQDALERLRPLARRSQPGLDDLPPPAEEWWSSPAADEGAAERTEPEQSAELEVEVVAESEQPAEPAAEGRSRPRPEDREDEDAETTAEPTPVYVGFDRLPDEVAGELDLLDEELAEPAEPAAEPEAEDDFVTEIFGTDADVDGMLTPMPGIVQLVGADGPPPGLDGDPELDPDLDDDPDDLVDHGHDGDLDPSVEADAEEPAHERSAAGAERDSWWFEDPSETEPVEDGDLLTRTMADLYARQGLIDEAASIYRELLAGRPEDPELLRALSDVEARLAPEPATEPEPGTEPEPATEPTTEPATDPTTASEPSTGPEAEAEPEPLSDADLAAELATESHLRTEAEPAAEAPAPAPPLDPYSTDPVPPRAAASEYFAGWLRRLSG